jgi:GPH family glycoside/pentoside/hexuronide:cation symporter
MATTSINKVPGGTKILYGIADIGLALEQAAVQFFLLFYFTDIAGINPGLAATALMVSKLTWDAVNDPLFGWWSDRTKSRWGRRRPFMLLAAVPMGLAFWLMFSLPQGLTGWLAFLAVLGTYLLFDTFHTMISMAYYAMTAEMSTDYKERTSITATRMVFSIVGYILGAAATTIVVGLFASSLGWTERASWSGMGLTFGVVATVVVLTTAFSVRRKPVVNTKPSEIPPVSAVIKTLRNKPFVKFLIATGLASIAFTLITSLLPYYLIYQLNMEAELPFVMFAMLGTIAIFLFPTKLLSDRINKGPAYAFGLILASLAIIGTFLLPHHATPIIYIIAIVAGIGFAGQYVFPGSMIPDVVEIDEIQTGERREGLYFGIWSFIGKLTGALGIAISGWALAGFGYQEGVAQTPTALLGIRLFFCLIPAIILIASTPLLFRYPITKESHAQLVNKLGKNVEPEKN